MVPVRAGALRKAAVSAGIICALALVLGLMLVRRGEERGDSPASKMREDAATIASAAPVESPPEHPAPFEETVAEEAPPLELQGTLVLIDEDGAEHPEEDGELVILRSASGEEPIRVAVTAGKWRTQWTGPAFPAVLHVMGIRAGGVDAEVEGRIPVLPEGEVHIRATWLPPAPVLEVIGKDTGVGLERVTLVAGSWVVRGKTFGSSATPHGPFGPEQVLIESESSPLVLERTSANARRLQGNCTVWARAPGY